MPLNQYDPKKFSQEDLDAIKEIRDRVTEQKQETDKQKPVAKEDVFTLAHSLDFAE